MLPAILAPLLQQGLSLISNAVLAKGQDWVEDKLGVKLNDPMTPEQVAKLKQAEMEHEEELMRLKVEDNKLDLEAYKVEVEDHKSAHERETRINESQNASWLSKNTGSLLALGFTVIFLAMGYLSVFNVGVEYREAPFNAVFNTMSQIVMLIIGYYYGSSKDMKNVTSK